MNEEDKKTCEMDRGIEIDEEATVNIIDVHDTFAKISLPARIMVAGPTMAGDALLL